MDNTDPIAKVNLKLDF